MKYFSKKSGQKITKRLNKFSRQAKKEGVAHLRKNFINRISHIKTVRLLILEWSLLVISIIMLATTQAFLYTESYAADSFVKGGAFTEATLGEVHSLNPLFAVTESEQTLAKLLFAHLTATDYSGHTGFDLAESISSDQTGKIWTVKLRPNLKWSDGQPLTNQDVIFTVETIQNPKINTPLAANLTGVSLEEKDGKLIFKLPAAYVNFPSSLNIPILPAHVLAKVSPDALLDHKFSSTPISSGPFSFNAVQNVSVEGEKIVYLTANPYYYKGRTLLDSMAVHAFTDKKSVAAALRSGSATATASLAPSDGEEVRSASIYEKQTTLNNGVFAFFNTQGKIFNNLGLRKAVQQGLDLRSLRAPLNEEPALDYPILPGQVENVDFPALPKYNPDSAKASILSAKLPANSTVNLATVSTGYLPALADNLKFQLQNLGFKVEVNIHEPNQEFLVNVIRPRAYDILLYEVELGSSPDLYSYYHSSQAKELGLNLSNYSNLVVDDLILAARSTTNRELRAVKYSSFLKYWLDHAPAIGIYQTNLSYYFHKNVRTFSEDNHLVYPVDRFSDVFRWSAQKDFVNRTP